METELAGITHLVLSGGGLSGFAYLGALGHLQTLRPKLQHVAGTSIGAFFGFLLCLGAEMTEVRDYVAELLRTKPELLEIPVENLFQFLERFGIVSLDPLIGILEHFAKGSVTFAELAARGGPRFTVAVTELYSGACHYFSAENTPDVPVLDAVRASMSIPFLSPPVTFPDCPECLYVDGFLTDNFPLAAFADEEVGCSLGIAILPAPVPAPLTARASLPFPEFAYLVLQTARETMFSFRKHKRSVQFFLCLDDPPIPSVPMDLKTLSIQISPDQIQKSFDYGWESFKKLKIKKKQNSDENDRLPTDSDS